MRTKHLNEMRIIEGLINNRDMDLRQIRRECGVEDDTIHSKTLARYLDELIEEKYIVCKEGKYRLNREQFLVNNHGGNDVWEKLLNCAIESGEIDCYRKIKEFIKPELQDSFLSDEALTRYKETIVENIKILNEDENKIRLLKAAIQEETELCIAYKGKLIQILPLCIVVSRDGVRYYLYGLRKKNILPMELAKIQIVKILDKKTIPNRETYLNMINRSWDIEIHDPIHVKVLFRKKYDTDGMIEKQLKKYFGQGREYKENLYAFEGELIGINDFKRWIREHMEICCIVEPQTIREEFMEALAVRINRYEQNG